MLIQNAGNSAQSPQPARLTSDGAPEVVAAKQSSVAVESPRIAPEQAAHQQPSPEQLRNAVDSINQAMRQSNRNLEFSVDPDTKKPIVKMVDTETGKLIRQFPSEETLAISRSIDQFLQRQGLLLSQKA